jgi:hypothetical protein
MDLVPVATPRSTLPPPTSTSTAMPPARRREPWDFQLGVDASPMGLRQLRPDYVRYTPQRSPGSGRYRYQCRAFFNTPATPVAPPPPSD